MRVQRLAAPVWNIQPQQQHFGKDDPDVDPDKDPDVDPDKEEDPDPDVDPDKDPDEKDWKRLSRQNESAKNAEKKRADALEASLNQIKEKLGLAAGDTLTPEQMNAKLSEKDQQVKAALIESKVARTAKEHADTLLDSKSFMDKVSELDPSDDDFSKDLKAIVARAIKDKGLDATDGTKKKTTKSGGPVGDDDNGAKQLTRADLKDMKPGAILAARQKGQLKDIGIEPIPEK